MNITMDKQYRTNAGRPVRLLCVDAKNRKPVVGLVTYEKGFEVLNTWTICGIHSRNTSEPMSLVEVGPYDDFKIDDPVMVRNADSGEWARRYFAGVRDDGTAMTFANGGTSWSAEHTVTWEACRRPTKDELKGEQSD